MSKDIPSDKSIRWFGKQFRHHTFKLTYIGQSNENMSEENEKNNILQHLVDKNISCN